MKTKAILAFVVAGALSFTACNKKVDEKTVTEVNQFGTEWSALGENATNWSKQLMATQQQAKEFATKQTEMMNTMANTKDEAMKTQMQNMVTTANQNAANFDNMVTEWTAWKGTWDDNTRMYTEWQAKVVKGEVTPEEATTGLAAWRTKMTEAQQKVDTWNTAYNNEKQSWDNNMASMEEMSKNMTTTKMKK